MRKFDLPNPPQIPVPLTPAEHAARYELRTLYAAESVVAGGQGYISAPDEMSPKDYGAFFHALSKLIPDKWMLVPSTHRDMGQTMELVPRQAQ